MGHSSVRLLVISFAYEVTGVGFFSTEKGRKGATMLKVCLVMTARFFAIDLLVVITPGFGVATWNVLLDGEFALAVVGMTVMGVMFSCFALITSDALNELADLA